jgi:uroporphyrinogen decarboxylase
MLQQHLGTSDLLTAFRMDQVGVGPAPTRIETDFGPYFAGQTGSASASISAGEPVTWDEWGRGRIWDREQHYARYLYSLQDAETADAILAYPWPDRCEPYRYAHLAGDVDKWHAQGYAVVGELAETIFEIAWQLRSMDRLFEDMLHDDEKAALVLDAVTERSAYAARQMAQAGVDILFIGDDVAMQNGLMMSRKLWRKWLGPRLKQVIDAARAVVPDLPVQYHTDGKINDLIPDLIDIGVTILNPIQPECVDHSWIKGAYGAQLAFNGGLGVQSVLPFGTPDEVREHVRRTIETLGAGGGFVIAPSHVIERDTSIENILAIQQAIDDFGNYD